MARFNCPVEGARLTCKFGWRPDPFTNTGRYWHQGVDLASPVAGKKVPVYASAKGVVSRAQTLSTYGQLVMIRHTINGKTYETNYAHLDKIMVKVGQRVKQGEQIGIMGMTGSSTAVHLHFEIHNGLWMTGQPNAIDPMKNITLDSYTPLGKEGELTMSQYNELKKEIEDLKSALRSKQDKEATRKAGKSHDVDWEWLTANGITDGSNPQNDLTREQMATMLKRFEQYLTKKLK
ncbi:M23 family metallopeptidase [Lysinibacillus sp. fkY74-1]